MSIPGDVIWADARSWTRIAVADADDTWHNHQWGSPDQVGGIRYARTETTLETYTDFRWLVQDGALVTPGCAHSPASAEDTHQQAEPAPGDAEPFDGPAQVADRGPADDVGRRFDVGAKTPGRTWRIKADQVDGGTGFHAGPADPGGYGEHTTVFDELVIDTWLHIESMDVDTWWMRIGDTIMWVVVDDEGRAHVTLTESPEYDATDTHDGEPEWVDGFRDLRGPIAAQIERDTIVAWLRTTAEASKGPEQQWRVAAAEAIAAGAHLP